MNQQIAISKLLSTMESEKIVIVRKAGVSIPATIFEIKLHKYAHGLVTLCRIDKRYPDPDMFVSVFVKHEQGYINWVDTDGIILSDRSKNCTFKELERLSLLFAKQSKIAFPDTTLHYHYVRCLITQHKIGHKRASTFVSPDGYEYSYGFFNGDVPTSQELSTQIIFTIKGPKVTGERRFISKHYFKRDYNGQF